LEVVDESNRLAKVDVAGVRRTVNIGLFDDIAACLRRVVAHDLTALVIYDAERDGFRVAALAFENEAVVPEDEFLPLDDADPAASAAFRRGTPLRVGRDVIATIGAHNRPRLAEFGVESACLLPMSAGGRRVGAIVVGRLRNEPFSDDDLAILAAAAGQVAFAVGNALAFQEIAALRDKITLEKVYLEDELRSRYDFEEIVGESLALKAVLAQVETVAATSSTGRSAVRPERGAHRPCDLAPAEGADARQDELRAIRRVWSSEPSATSGRSPVRSRRRSAGSSSLTAERSFSTRSATFRSSSSPSCCASCKSTSLSASAARGRSMRTCGSWQRRIGASKRWSPRGRSGATSTTA
jgi:GAF domain-containing protein